MIKIPVCIWCIYRRDNNSCPAYPQGIPDEILFSRSREDKDCGNGVGFKKNKE